MSRLQVESRRGATVWMVVCLLTGLLSTFPADPCPAAELPTDLDLVPRDAAAFIHFRAADIWKADWMADVRHFVGKSGAETLKTFRRKFVPDLSTIDRVTLVMLTPHTLSEPFPRANPEAMSALLIVTTNKPYDRLAVRQKLGLREKMYRRHLYYFNEEAWTGLHLVDDCTFLIGSEDALVLFFDLHRSRRKDSPLLPALREAAGTHQLVIGLNPEELAQEPEAKDLPPPLRKLLEARCITLALDLDKEWRLGLQLDYDKAEAAKDGVGALRDSPALARLGLGEGIEELEKQLNGDDEPEEREPAEEQLVTSVGSLLGLGVLREVDTLLKEASIQQKDTTVSLQLSYKALPSTQVLVIGTMVYTVIELRGHGLLREGGGIHVRKGTDPYEAYFKKLKEGLDRYHAEKGSYPAAALLDKDGRPLLSWRVALLPYLGEEALYKEFHLDEPWDSLHNKKLLKKLPKVYQVPRAHRLNKTSLLAITGDATVFPTARGISRKDVGAGAILLADVAGGNGIYWSKPVDFLYADEKPLPRLFGKQGSNPLYVLLGDGTYRKFEPETDEKLLRSMMKRSGARPDELKLPEE